MYFGGAESKIPTYPNGRPEPQWLQISLRPENKQRDSILQSGDDPFRFHSNTCAKHGDVKRVRFRLQSGLQRASARTSTQLQLHTFVIARSVRQHHNSNIPNFRIPAPLDDDTRITRTLGLALV
jgi:hypothetical protein